MHYIPLALPFFMILVFLFAFLIVLIEIGILEYAYEQIGVNRRYMYGLLLLSILGSYVNIPVAQLPAEHVHSGQIVTFFGMRYIIPLVMDSPRTVVAVNLGGAGTFGGIFMTAVIAVLLASIVKQKHHVSSHC